MTESAAAEQRSLKKLCSSPELHLLPCTSMMFYTQLFVRFDFAPPQNTVRAVSFCIRDNNVTYVAYAIPETRREDREARI
jgi:hypothetical protein